jgi:hypothetical protein
MGNTFSAAATPVPPRHQPVLEPGRLEDVIIKRQVCLKVKLPKSEFKTEDEMKVLITLAERVHCSLLVIPYWTRKQLFNTILDMWCNQPVAFIAKDDLRRYVKDTYIQNNVFPFMESMWERTGFPKNTNKSTRSHTIDRKDLMRTCFYAVNDAEIRGIF